MTTERRWPMSSHYGAPIQTEVVKVVSFLVSPGGVPVSDRYGTVPGAFTPNRTVAVVIRPTGQYLVCSVNELWEVADTEAKR